MLVFASYTYSYNSHGTFILEQVAGNQSVVRRWRQARVLLVDEVSKLSGHMLELLDAVARRARGFERPMGGLQVVFCGDFFQVHFN